MHKTFQEDAKFLFVYIREAHPSDSNWPMGKIRITDPVNQLERNKVASQCRSKLSLTMPMVVDDMKDSVNQSYKAWPERIYIIDTQGKIVFKSGIGPFDFKPKKAAKALRKLLAQD